MTDQATRLTPAEEPPHDPDYDNAPPTIEANGRLAERLLLGSLLTRPELAETLLPAIDPADFHNPTYETIWETAADLYADGDTPDQLAIQQALVANTTFHRYGGPNLLLQLRDEAPLTPDPERYAREIRNASRYRRVASQLTSAQALVRAATPDSLEIALQNLVDVTTEAALAFGPRTLTPADTGLRDLTWIRDTGRAPEPPAPKFVVRDDGAALFYEGKVNGLFGDPETAKSWIAQAAGVEALHAGGLVCYLDLDHNGMDATAGRFLLLGARPEHLWDTATFRYYEPDDVDQLRAAVREVTTLAPAIYILDSLGEVLPMLGVASKDNDEITAALRAVVQPPADAGSCVITIDHLPKSTEARSTGFAIGGMAKKRAVRGAYLRVDAKTKPAPGQIGRSLLRIEKDSLGGLRATSPQGYAGEFILDSTQTGVTRWTLTNDHSPIAEDGSFRPTELMERVSRFVEDNDQCTRGDIQDHVKGKHRTLDTALEILVNEGFVHRKKGARNAWRHQSIAHYRVAEDDHATHDDRPPLEEPPPDDDPALWNS